MRALCENNGVETVPLLYRGAFSPEVLAYHTNGSSHLYGAKHIREGLVVKTLRERSHPKYGRKIAKSISEAYLLRKGEVSEFQ